MGKLILVNSGIGNNEDLSPRVRAQLRNGRYFAVEDSRKFRDLLQRLDIAATGKVIQSFHDHSGRQKLQAILAALEHHDVWVASDAGSPVICDPAFPLVQAAIQEGREVATASGVSSIVYALELSGLPTHPFSFWGFLPRTAGKRAALRGRLGQGTHIFFEAPHRLSQSMGEFAADFPQAPVVLAKELSKKHQHIERFPAGQWPQIEGTLDGRGEFVLLLYLQGERGVPGGPWAQEVQGLALDILQGGVGTKKLAKLLARILRQDGKQIYKKLQDVDRQS